MANGEEIILNVTLTGLPPILLFAIIFPDWFGTKSSGPFSPTINGLPWDTAPPFSLKLVDLICVKVYV